MNTISSMGDAACFKAIVERTITAFEDDQLTEIGDYAFRGCTQLTKITLPNVTDIGEYAFMSCNKLYDISLPSCVNIGYQSFYSCSSSSFTSLTLPAVETIGNGAFYNCNYLTTIDLPVVKTMGNEVFRQCTRLEKIILRNTDGVVAIGNNLLQNTPNAIIYVPDALVEDYKIATNWSSYFNRIKGLSELLI